MTSLEALNEIKNHDFSRHVSTYLFFLARAEVKKDNDLYNLIKKELKVLEIIINTIDITVDLREKPEKSSITIGSNVFKISYDKAKLLKEVLENEQNINKQ